MKRERYAKQVDLLIKVLNEISKEDSLAMHGGTAINLFHLNMPRYSVDIDLTYIPFSDNRTTDLNNIRQALDSVKTRLLKKFPDIKFDYEQHATENLKLFCRKDYVTIKVEVNQINRGLIADTSTMVLCDKAQEEFKTFCEAKIVSVGQLWGGKLNAAMERQHPRDIFDVKHLFKEIGLTEEIKQGFIFFLMCGKNPIEHTLNPTLKDQRDALENQFESMSDENFTYEEFEKIRKDLIVQINNSLTDKDKEFILSYAKGEPDWSDFDYSKYPAIKWKLLNIQKLKELNPIKHKEQIQKLKNFLQVQPSQSVEPKVAPKATPNAQVRPHFKFVPPKKKRGVRM